MTRDQRVKPCAGGCGRKTRGVRCMECFNKIPARERAGDFGKFQIRPSHLITSPDEPPAELDTTTQRALEGLAGALDDGTRWTTCTCLDGKHRDPKAALRSHRSKEFAEIVARHTGRHVIPAQEVTA